MIMDCWGGAKIRCEFSQTQINTDNIVLKTIFHNVPDSTLYINPETIRKENTLIQGKNGEDLVLTKKGQVMGKTEFNATGGNSVLLKEYHRKSDSLAQWQINFSKYDAQTYAFDYLGSGNHGIFSGADYYPQSGSYDFRYKSVECGKNDKVIVEFDTYPEKDSVVFKDKYGVTYPVSLKDNVLSFTGVSKADTNYIYAYRGDQKIGKLFLNTYKRQTKYIELVSVNGGTIDKTITAEGLSKIFNCAVVDFKIEIKSLDIRDLKTFTHGGSNWHSVYNDDQKKVLEAYDSLMKDDKFYLFFVDNVLDKKDSLGTSVSGYMPRGYNAGFIYDGGSPHTIAHELGHGIAGLEHVFENSNNSGKTVNLMDYANGEELWHFQWDQIQDPSRVWMKWNKAESEGESIEKLNPLISFKIKGNKTKEYEYENGGLFATMHTNDKITIEIISKDTTLNTRNLSCFFDKNILPFTDSLNNKVELTLDEKTISLKGNLLSVKDSLNKEIASFKFQAYLPPYVEFSIDDKTYNGEFLFDDSFRRIKNNDIYNPNSFFAQYQQIFVGEKNKVYYAPVLGLRQKQIAKLSLKIKELDNLFLKDNNGKIIISSDNSNVKINNDIQLIIEPSNINTINEINIQFIQPLQKSNKDTTGVLLHAVVPSLNNKRIGLMECYCQSLDYKQVTLIYVRFSNKDIFPTYDYNKLKDYLNNYSFNQLFKIFQLDTIHLDAFINDSNPYFKQLSSSTQKKLKNTYNKGLDYFKSVDDNSILSHLEWFHHITRNLVIERQKEIRNELKAIPDSSSVEFKKLQEEFRMLSLELRNTIVYYPENYDYFYITDIDREKLGGFHNPGTIGGVQVKYKDSKFNETKEELTAHEFGHWLGLPHVFEDNSNYPESKVIRFTKNKPSDSENGQSTNNFMDYNIHRKSWFRNQLINVK